MIRLASAIATVLAALTLPASALAFQGYPASSGQRATIERSAEQAQPCGYSGNFKQLSDFRTVTYHTGSLTVQFASVIWSPPQDDECQLVFVHQAGYNLRSVLTTRHPFVSWVPLTWGSSPFEAPSSLTHTWHSWFSQAAPTWLAVDRALIK
jgi:hypothetical protein